MNDRSKHYTVMARRFRPQLFSEVMGQQHVAQALQNAIQHHRVAHAYLFTGARGVGKTSMARILAKALNCPEAEEGTPCNNCDICRGISSGNDVDVLEIDGASNRGIDDIRSLRANVAMKSMRTPYKIYIIDEVHMLTKEAFNALLKTLEEPPERVKFVFCTTEPNKVPDTILSRCQRFDFSSISTTNIVRRLEEIAKTESCDVAPAALEIVARRAAGSMRDSQSLFDQLLAFGEDRITPEDVHRLLGTADDDRLVEFVDALVERRRDRVFTLCDGAVSDGVQMGELVDQLLTYLRDLLVLVSGADGVELISVSGDKRPILTAQAKSWGAQTIIAAAQILAETKTRMLRIGAVRTLVELALVRIALLEDLDDLDSLIRQLQGEAGSTPPRQHPPVPAGKADGLTLGETGLPEREAASRRPQQGLPEKKTENAEILGDPTVDKRDSELDHVDFRPGLEPELWSQVLSHIDSMLKDHLSSVSNIAISGPNELDLAIPRSYHFSKQYCEQPEVLARLERLTTQVAGKPIRITFRLVEVEADSSVESEAAASSAEFTSVPPSEVACDTFVEEAKAIFGATVIKVDKNAAGSSSGE
jgi:DNA polymerase-3 subunit gamma/tau